MRASIMIKSNVPISVECAQGSTISQASKSTSLVIVDSQSVPLRFASEASDTSFDWFKNYSQISDIIHEFVKPDSRILMLGCGNSTLSEEVS